ncbi:MAG TPA: hypothetical protein VGO80_10955 [Solirubrobacteraceae bacterium]|jgi:hypothetical protein|nr:hypothetical protein [Solirubrobacteraceae bacterium]
MSAVAKFLQGKVDEGLTKFLQPAGLVPAALVVLLNLAFVLPALTTAGVEIAVAFAALDETWQIVAVGMTVIFLGYLLISLSGNVLDLFSGGAWRGSALYSEAVKVTKNRLIGKQPPKPPKPGSLEALSDAWELRAAYPIGRVDPNVQLSKEMLPDVGPTRLGNAIRATHKLVFDRYGIDVVALWPQMEASTDKDAVAMRVANDAKASLDTLANIAFVLGAFAVEGLLLFSAQGDWARALLSTLAFPVAYVTYRAAATKARAWGDTIETVFDLHREELHKDLDLREHTSAEDERELWTATSRVFLWGRDGEEDDEIFDGQPAVEVTAAKITASRNVEVAKHGDDDAKVPGLGEAEGRRVARVIEYALVISQTGEHAVSDAVVAVRDRRVLRIAHVPDLTVAPANGPAPTCRIVGSGTAPDSLVIRAPRLRKGGAMWLGFSLPVWEALVPEGFTVSGAPAHSGTILDFVVKRVDDEAPAPWLDVFANLWSSTPWLAVKPGTGTRRPPTTVDRRHRFTLTDADIGMTLRVTFPEEVNDEG